MMDFALMMMNFEGCQAGRAGGLAADARRDPRAGATFKPKMMGF